MLAKMDHLEIISDYPIRCSEMATEQEMKCPDILENVDETERFSFVKYKNVLLASSSAFMYVLVMGMVSSYSAPATADMKLPGSRFRDITPDEITWIASLPMISGIFGNFFSGYLTQKLGRQAMLMLLSIPFVLSWLIIAYAPTIGTLFLGRIVAGLAAGIVVATVPTYIVEIAPTEIRGLLASGFQVSLSLGVLIAMGLGTAFRWSWLAISGAAIMTLGAFMMLFMPESPPWLIRVSRTGEAFRALKYLRGKGFNARKEIIDLQKNSASHQQDDAFKVKDVILPSFYKPLALGMALMFFHIFSGYSVILAYTVDIFQQSGSSIQANVASIIVATVQAVATVFSSLLMDRMGRRRLYLASGLSSSISHLVCGTYLYIVMKNNVDQHLYGWIPLVCIMVFIFSFVMGVGAVPFVVVPEVSPLRSRSTIMALTTVFLSLMGFLTIKTFEDVKGLVGMYGMFWMYGFFMTLCVIFGYFFLPETKGLNLQEVESKYADK